MICGHNLRNSRTNRTQIHIAVAERNPLSGRAARVLEHHRVAHVCRYHIWRQRFQRHEGIFHTPDRVAGVQARSHKIPARFFDDCLYFARLHIAGMILERDLYSQVHRLRTHRAEDLDRVLHVRFDGQRSQTVIARTHVAPHGFRPDRLGHLQPFQQLLRAPADRSC